MLPPSLNELLKQTSRSFYLTLRVLPGAVRPQIGLAYLLARTTDTIADTEIVSVTQRLEALQQLRARVLGTSSAALNFGDLARQQGLPAERMLLERVEESLIALRGLSQPDLKLAREVLDTITAGQELDLRWFGPGKANAPLSTASPASGGRRAEDGMRYQGSVIALQTDAELDDYTYRVAGCVGEFWTKICRVHLFPTARLDDARLVADGIRFGKGLQLVNILRDLSADLQKGRCYLPAEGLAQLGLSPADLMNPANEPRLRPLYDHWLERAESHLAAGWAYTNALPRRHVRVRLACAWPILIGMKTLARLRVSNVLDPQRRVKVTRPEVRALMLRTVVCHPFPSAWGKLFSASKI